MKRWIATHEYVAGDPTALERTLLLRVRELLLSATDSPPIRPAADGSFPIEVHGSVAGIDIGTHLRATLGVARRSGSRVVVPLRWEADHTRPVLPTLDATIELEPLDAESAELSLFGSYRVPLGPLGAVADATVLRNVAVKTTEALLRRLAAALEEAVGAGQRAEHPAGPRRGRALLVRDVMTSDPFVLDPDMSLRTAAVLLFHLGVSGAPVVAPSGELVGVLSERDLLVKEAHTRAARMRVARDEAPRRAARTVAEACTSPARTTVPDALLSAAAREMLDHDVSRLIVVDGSEVAGIVSRHDVLAALVRDDDEISVAVDRVLGEYAEPNVRAEVIWGEVTLSGMTELRSTADYLIEAVAAVDGVIDVDGSGLRWQANDLVPPIPIGPLTLR
jgi:CBS domain-containing protein